ncbi:cellulose binding domain-containing protein [Lachnotalea glycerini]|uniref:Cellulose binding domain-containing protein n=1 Tax=Lachnotalea glycerini TaxID=1763509 RepID=A0A318EQD5_9FIRM|nr:glycoside hydrolase family 9 protein [Lachnotalea glycerini]PXV93691.1 cellulose binding domain-containing protein [Lachnotalea glycerini]
MKYKKLKKSIICALALSLTFNMGFTTQLQAATEATDDVSDEETFNYAKAFQLSMYFYDANKCGPGVNDGALSWRGDCHLEDQSIPLTPVEKDGKGTNLSENFIEENIEALDPDGDGCVNLSGGFHDAGDHVKFGLPQSYSGSTLGWGFYEFRDAYVKVGEQEHIEEILRWFNDYFIRCTFRDAEGKVVAFAYQVGDGTTDHTYWGSPELQTTSRPAWFASSETPASDQCAGAAASLAINYLNFKETDPAYADTCLDTAKALYDFAKENRGTGFSGGFYNSSYDEDEMSWAGVWLKIATGEDSYIDDIISVDSNGKYTGYMQKIISTTDSTWQNIWVHSWDTVWGGVFAKLAPITNNPEHWYFFRWNLEYWSGTAHEETNDTNFLAANPSGYRVLNTWGSARYNTAAQLCALVYNQYKPNQDFVEWCKGQMDYLLGDNPMNRCYEVGYADNSAKNPHHRAAHGSLTNSMLEPETEKHVLWGALVGGPDKEDYHADEVTDYVYNEVAIDYNAGFVGALAALYSIYGEGQEPDATLPLYQEDETPYFVEAKIEQENTERTQLTIKVTNDTSCPPKRVDTLKARYFFDISEMLKKGQTIQDLTIPVFYDQALTQDGIGVNIEGPYAWNEEDGIYYVDLDWSGISFHGSREIQIGLVPVQDASYQVNWDPTNDWSRQTLTKESEMTDYIPLYLDDQLVYGQEPEAGEDIEDAIIAITTPLEGTLVDMTNEDAFLEVTAESTGISKDITKIELFANGDKIGEADADVCNAVYTLPTDISDIQDSVMDVTLTAQATLANGEIKQGKPVKIKLKLSSTVSDEINLSLVMDKSENQSSNTITKKFSLNNTGEQSVDLSTVKIRYYYTKEANVKQVFYCDDAGISYPALPWYETVTEYLSGKFVNLDPAKENADTYLELSFDQLKKSLEPGKSLVCKFRIANSDWSEYNQENDYSNIEEDGIVILSNDTVISGTLPLTKDLEQ